MKIKVVLRMNEESRQETWTLNGKTIGEAKEYKYLGVCIKGGTNGG